MKRKSAKKQGGASARARQMLTCLRCGWQWFTRGSKEPDTCPNPKCRSPYWNRPRRAEQ